MALQRTNEDCYDIAFTETPKRTKETIDELLGDKNPKIFASIRSVEITSDGVISPDSSDSLEPKEVLERFKTFFGHLSRNGGLKSLTIRHEYDLKEVVHDAEFNVLSDILSTAEANFPYLEVLVLDRVTLRPYGGVFDSWKPETFPNLKSFGMISGDRYRPCSKEWDAMPFCVDRVINVAGGVKLENFSFSCYTHPSTSFMSITGFQYKENLATLTALTLSGLEFIDASIFPFLKNLVALNSIRFKDIMIDDTAVATSDFGLEFADPSTIPIIEAEVDFEAIILTNDTAEGALSSATVEEIVSVEAVRLISWALLFKYIMHLKLKLAVLDISWPICTPYSQETLHENQFRPLPKFEHIMSPLDSIPVAGFDYPAMVELYNMYGIPVLPIEAVYGEIL